MTQINLKSAIRNLISLSIVATLSGKSNVPFDTLGRWWMNYPNPTPNPRCVL